MAFMDKLKSMVYEDVPETQAPQQVQSTSGIGATNISQSQSSQLAGLNQDMVTAIKKVTFGRNTAFTQLLQTSEALADVIPDQVMRLKAAHKTAGGGRSGKQIADAVDVHLQDIDGEEMRFKATVDQKITAEVGSLEAQSQLTATQIEQANLEIKRAQEHITAMQTSIQQLTQKGAELTAEIAKKRIDFDTAQAQFKAAAQAVRNELAASKAAILSTLV